MEITAVCDESRLGEKPGTRLVTRTVHPISLTPGNLKTIWERARPFPTLFGQEINGSLEHFTSIFIDELPDGSVRSNGLFWVLDDFVGIYYLTNIRPGIDAQVHYSFFDRRSKGREEISKKLLESVMREYDFHRLTAELPLYAHHSIPFIEGVGFKKEGTKILAAPYRGRWYDVYVYGYCQDMDEYQKHIEEVKAIKRERFSGLTITGEAMNGLAAKAAIK